MPLPEKYLREQRENRAIAEREAQRETRLAWLRVLGEIAAWTLAGLAGIGMALHSHDFDVGMAWWWGGSALWVGGVSATVLTAYRRGEKRGDW
jgi:hypothetical protein